MCIIKWLVGRSLGGSIGNEYGHGMCVNEVFGTLRLICNTAGVDAGVYFKCVLAMCQGPLLPFQKLSN